MSDCDEKCIKSLFNDVLSLLNFEVDIWAKQAYEKLVLEDRFSKWAADCYGNFGNCCIRRYFEDEHEFLSNLGKIEKFRTHWLFKNPFFGCRSLEEVKIKLDLMSSR